MDAGGARSDRADDHRRGRQQKVIGVVLANPEEIHADLVGKDPLFDDVPDCLSVREWAVILVVRDIAEGVEAEGKWELHGCSTRRCCCHVDALLLVWVWASRGFPTLPRPGQPAQTRFGATTHPRHGPLNQGSAPPPSVRPSPRPTQSPH